MEPYMIYFPGGFVHIVIPFKSEEVFDLCFSAWSGNIMKPRKKT